MVFDRTSSRAICWVCQGVIAPQLGHLVEDVATGRPQSRHTVMAIGVDLGWKGDHDPAVRDNSPGVGTVPGSGIEMGRTPAVAPGRGSRAASGPEGRGDAVTEAEATAKLAEVLGAYRVGTVLHLLADLLRAEAAGEARTDPGYPADDPLGQVAATLYVTGLGVGAVLPR